MNEIFASTSNTVEGGKRVNPQKKQNVLSNEGKSGQPEPLSGSKKTKNQNHSRQTHNKSHDL